MNLSRIALWLLLVVAVFTIAAASSDEHPEEALGEGDDEQAVGEEHDGEASEGDDELAPGEGDADLALGEEHDGEASGGDDADSVYEHALSEVQIGNMMKKIDFNGDGKASLDEFKLFAQNSALLNSQKQFDDQHNAGYSPKTIDEHLEDIKKTLGEVDASTLEIDREKLVAADTNKDGTLDKDEYFRFFSASDKDVLNIEAKLYLKQADVNKDGFIDVGELAKHHLLGSDLESAGQPQDEEHQAYLQKDAGRQLALLDKDGNGKLDVGEYASYFTLHHQDEMDSVYLVEAADANEDGLLDLEELVKYIGNTKPEAKAEQLGKEVFERWAYIHGEL
eukprot:TRINITY_DN863_c0_g1_i1.p1 TRINITY_DN863_c0_g1~~TRINITY_DN863_c0_g1_i1.p1  ORF type:complete len:336 (-),score=92.59 TRINITY_DN863_c0_g1_i1:453-1460(-)